MQNPDPPPSYFAVINETTTTNASANETGTNQPGINLPNYQPSDIPSSYSIPQSNPTAPPPPLAKGYVPSYGSIHPTAAITIPTEIIIVGGCPACRIGILENDYPCLGWLCAILFFPIGILFCLLMRQKRCTHCGAEF
ncbi:brain protein I3 [Condylostylus longicornis]|uniref:brain protein I3 n=1 Tax=Condylostylus longicornis TaxID=2530218 RepID=UPI00244D9CA8|nr:brain protein I3 [Condylostylus longicornis]